MRNDRYFSPPSKSTLPFNRSVFVSPRYFTCDTYGSKCSSSHQYTSEVQSQDDTKSIQDLYTVVGTFATISRVIVMLYYNKVQNRAVPPSQVVGQQHRTRVRSCPVAVMCRSIVARVHPKCKSFQNASQGNPFGCCSRVEHPWPIPQGFNPYQNNCATSYRRPGA